MSTSTVRQYELVYIVPPETTEEAIAELHTQIAAVVELLSAASVKTRLVEILADPKIAVASVNEAHPSKPSPLRPDVMTLVESLTRQMYPGAVVVPVMSTGATDGLYMRNGEIPTYGVEGTFGDMDDVRAHGRDERVGVKQYFEGLEFQYRLIKALAQK